jgi:GntR family transcriptional regulator
MAQEQKTADALAQAVLQRITTGQYAPGERLPTVRKLAEEIGSSRNTVSKAYQKLNEMGIIESNVSGHKGYYVKKIAQAGSESKSELIKYFYEQVKKIAWQGMAAGIGSEEMLAQMQVAIGEVFGYGKVKLIFFECNDHDTVEMGHRLIEVLGMNVIYKNLSYFYINPEEIFTKFDLIITTYHHLAEITETLRSKEFFPGKVVGIDTRITAESMLRIARFPMNRIGIVATNQNTAHMLKHIIYGYHPEWEIEATTLENQKEIRSLISSCDHYIATHTSAEEVEEMTGREPDVILNFQIDEQSIDFLNQRIYQIQLDKINEERK